jgi:hypothetical protein
MSNSTKITTQTQDLYSLDTILPAHLRDNLRFKEFLEAYFEWQQESATDPANIINRLVDARDVDNIADEFLGYIQREVAMPISNLEGVDRRKLYKHLTDLYLSKGSIPSYEALFNLLFQDQIELYFPRVDVLKLSDGKWDNTAHRYLDNNGFLSDRKYIQDSYYYQDYSYVIKTSKTLEYWKDIVTKILHPAGFIFFGQIKIISVASLQKLKMSLNQPGTVAGEAASRPIILDPVTMRMQIAADYIHIRSATGDHPFADHAIVAFGPTLLHLEQVKFNLLDTINAYEETKIVDTVTIPAPTLKSNIMPGSLKLGLGTGYIDSTITITAFAAAQPADLSSESYDDYIDLQEPDTIYAELDLQ